MPPDTQHGAGRHPPSLSLSLSLCEVTMRQFSTLMRQTRESKYSSSSSTRTASSSDTWSRLCDEWHHCYSENSCCCCWRWRRYAVLSVSPMSYFSLYSHRPYTLSCSQNASRTFTYNPLIRRDRPSTRFHCTLNTRMIRILQKKNKI